jgi:hypothetical protein
MNACANGHLSVVKTLLGRGATVDLVSNVCAHTHTHCCHSEIETDPSTTSRAIGVQTNETALYLACENGYADIVRVLLEAKANYKLKTLVY